MTEKRDPVTRRASDPASDPTVESTNDSADRTLEFEGHPSAIGDYRVLGELGRGGMGIVYRAQDGRLGRDVALKVLPSAMASDPRRLERFRNEARLLAALNHPNVATIYSLEEFEGRSFLTMECIEGETLSARLLREGPSIDGALGYLRQIAAALEAAHRKGVVHRDLKPGNVLATNDGQVKVVDFGLAVTLTAERATEARRVMGTPGYMSPEQAKGDAVDERADLWAFGCILYEWLTGVRAFDASTATARIRQSLEQEIDLGRLEATVSPRLRGLLSSCLSRDLDGRLSTAAAARRILEEEIAARELARLQPSGEHASTTEEGRPRTSRLPRPLTAFIGREAPRRDLAARLAEHRLVTVTGFGGSGKSRLALEVARDLEAQYPAGVFWVELGSLTDGELVADAVGRVLGEIDPALPVREALLARLRGRRALLCLDNGEHVRAPLAELTRALLEGCADLRVLTTSREPLDLAGEALFPLSPLESNEAVRLFVARAQAADQNFQLTPQNAVAVAEICRELDGIPLALELAAARTRALSVGEIAQRLEHRFRLLTSSAATALPQHRTLKALVDWSYEQLSEDERVLFRRLAVCPGGWSLELAEAIACDEKLEAWQVLDLLSNLVQKSLVEIHAEGSRLSGRARYRFLSTVRQYAGEHLDQAGERAAVTGRFREALAQLADRAEPHLAGPGEREWIPRLDQEQANFSAALESGLKDDPSVAIRTAAALGRYWDIRGRWSEGRALLTRCLEHPSVQAADHLRARLLGLAGNLAYNQSDYVMAQRLQEECLAIGRAAGDSLHIAACLSNIANIRSDLGDLLTSRALFEEGLGLYRQIGHRWGLAATLANLGIILWKQQEYREARTLMEEGLELFRELTNQWAVAYSLNHLGLVAFALGDLSLARRYQEEALALQQELGDPRGIALSYQNLAEIAWREGNSVEARRLSAESVVRFNDLGARLTVLDVIDAMLPAIAGERGAKYAVRVAAASARIREAEGFPRPEDRRTDYEASLAALAAELGDERFRSLFEAGARMSYEELIAQFTRA